MSEFDTEKIEDTNACEVSCEDTADNISKESAKEFEKRIKKELFREVMIACACVAGGSVLMFLIMMLCMSFSMALLLGSIMGMVISVLYWLLLYISKTTVIKIPYMGRMVILIVLVIIGLKFDCFYNWAVLIPLAFTKPLAYIFLFIESRKS